jgi:hypothetical protein
MRPLKIGLIAAGLLLTAAPLHWVLPGTDVVVVTGAEVKRMDDGAGGTRDIYFIFAEDPESRAPRVFRNEDTGFGFPPYFKFASANLQASANRFAADRQMVAVTHYGWRIPMISAFPNAVSMTAVEPGHRHIPIFNIVFLAVLAGLLLLVRSRMRRMIGGVFGARVRSPAAPAAPATASSDVSDWMSGEDRKVGHGSSTSAEGGSDARRDRR